MDGSRLFDVVTQGRPVAGKDPAAVARALAQLMKIPEEQAAQLLCGKAKRVVRGVQEERAQKYVQALTRAGIVASAVAQPAAQAQTGPSGEQRHSSHATEARSPSAVAEAQPAPRSFAAAAPPSAGTQPSASAARNPRRAHGLPVVPIALGIALTVAAIVLVLLALGPSDPPRYTLLEPANDMMRDVLKLRRTLLLSDSYAKVVDGRSDDTLLAGVGVRQFDVLMDDVMRQTQGRTSLTAELQDDVEQSGIASSILESQSRIGARLVELRDQREDYSEACEKAVSRLDLLFESYRQLVDLGLHPSSNESLIGFASGYEMGLNVLGLLYVNHLAEVATLEAGDPADEEFFRSEQEEGLDLSAQLREVMEAGQEP